MCDYSLHSVSSRPAKVADKLVTTRLPRSKARAFAAVGEHGAKLVIHDSPPEVAVCLLPGTELAFDDAVRYERAFSLLGKGHVKHKVARFRQIDLDDPHVHHDALEFPDGQVLKITRLAAGQTATVLQLPVATQHAEHLETGDVARSPDSRVTLNRSFRPGTASILVPNQGAVMLWQALRSTAVALSTALVQSFGSLKARTAAPATAHMPAPSFNRGARTVMLPAKARTPAKTIEVKAA
jgi:hypothetical protein